MKSLNKVDSNANKIVALSWCRTKAQCFVGVCLYITIAHEPGRGTPKENIQPCTWIQLRIAALHEDGGLTYPLSHLHGPAGSVCIHKSIASCLFSWEENRGRSVPPPPPPPLFENILFIPQESGWTSPFLKKILLPPPPPFFLILDLPLETQHNQACRSVVINEESTGMVTSLCMVMT